jgi:hypothetical protein
MSFDAEEFVLYQIANAPVLRHPFTHLFIQPIFPEDTYQRLRASLPPLEWMRPIDDTGAVKVVDDTEKKIVSQAYPGRYIADVAEIEERAQAAGAPPFWSEFAGWLMSNRFRKLLLQKFGPDITQRFGPDAGIATEIDARLVRDFTDYAIGPHTDTPRKLLSLLFYLPGNDSLSHLGTSIFAPQDPAFRCEGNRHHSFDGFRKVASMPFVPNALFAFFKTDRSFHGLDQINEGAVQRDLLLYNIYVQAVRRPGPASFLLPWRRKKAVTSVFKPE